jgi:hypothetical protein
LEIEPERFGKRFHFKGAQLFALWAETPHRPTRDVDLLGSGEPSPESLKRFFEALLAGPCEPEDGLVWGEVEAAPIREDQRYEGVRVLTRANLAGAVVRVQIDVGFGDAITPGAIEVEWRELLGFPEARLLAYPPETVIAEKLEAATVLGLANSRMKDFFDLDWLCRNREFSPVRLVRDWVLWKTRNFRNLGQKALAWREVGAYIASSRRPDGLFRGPRNGPEVNLSVLSWVFFGLLRIAEKTSRKTVDGKTARGLYPAPHANGAGLTAGTDAADSRTKVRLSERCLTL